MENLQREQLGVNPINPIHMSKIICTDPADEHGLSAITVSGQICPNWLEIVNQLYPPKKIRRLI